MSAARQVKAITAGIAECVTEDHLPIRWNYGTRPANYWHWRAIRRRNPIPSLSNNNYLQQLTTNYVMRTATANYFGSSSLEPFSTTGSTDSDLGVKPEPLH